MLNIKNCFLIVKCKLLGICDVKKMNDYLSLNNGCFPILPKDIKEIASNAFDNLVGIKHIYLPITLQKINADLFKNNRGVIINFGGYYNIVVKEISPDKLNKLNFKLIGIQDKKKFENYCKTHNGENPPIPMGVESIADYAFKDSQNLKHLILPESTICLCKQACANCINLETVNLSKRFIDFGEEVFSQCSSLKRLNIPATINIMRSNVITGCSKNLQLHLFNKYKCSYQEFLLRNYFENQENILSSDKNNYKTLRTNNYIFVFNKEKQYKIKIHQLLNNCVFNKHTGQNPQNFNNSIELFKGEELLCAFNLSKEFKEPMPDDLIISNLNCEELKVYFQRKNIFEKILTKIRLHSNYETTNTFGEKTKRLKDSQYELLIKIMCLTGLFEANVNPSLSTNFIKRDLFGVERISSRSLNLSFEEVFSLFNGLLLLNNVVYNEEFCKYFLFNYENLTKLIIKLKESKDPNYLSLLIKNCGKSNVKYIHSNVIKDSPGMLHDKWINYKENNNNKQVNINNQKEEFCLSFIDWAIKYGDGSHVFTDLKLPKTQIKKISPFLQFYIDVKPLKRLAFIFKESEKIFPYVFYDENNPSFYIQRKSFNIAKIDSNVAIERNFDVLYCKDSNLQKTISKSLVNDLKSDSFENVYAKIVPKNCIDVAFSNCEMGHCANVKSNGCEYLYESYFDMNCQPFIIYRRESNKEIPIAGFRIDINRECGVCAITCLEVKREVKFSYNYHQKKNIVKAFDDIIQKFIICYKKFFKNKIRLITMGQITHCDINDVLSDFYQVDKGPYKCVVNRKVVSPSEYNHFILYKLSKE